jgi:hypothetical protein
MTNKTWLSNIPLIHSNTHEYAMVVLLVHAGPVISTLAVFGEGESTASCRFIHLCGIFCLPWHKTLRYKESRLYVVSFKGRRNRSKSDLPKAKVTSEVVCECDGNWMHNVQITSLTT